jgi:predicted RNA-binding Zn-ribbon protein involved in translation (DUF1610 family)
MGLLELLKNNLTKGGSGHWSGKKAKCPNCGESVDLGMERCPKCGVRIKSMFRMKCPKCGELNILEAKKCSKCFYSFEAELERAKRTYYYCPLCGYKMEGNYTRCPACGARFM